MVEILSLGAKGLENYMLDIGHKPFHAKQVLRWIYGKGVRNFEEMTDLKKTLREWLVNNAFIEELHSSMEGKDSEGTARIVTELSDKRHVESVIIRNEGRVTLCISSQVGCAFGCAFCLTGKMGLVRNLTTSEIVWQVMGAGEFLQEEEKITNIVFMGMGEPLQNLDNLLTAIEILNSPYGFDFGKRKITVSTAGYIPGITKLRESGCGVNLAVSLNAANDELRSQLMPINKTYPLGPLKESLRRIPKKGKKRIVIAYILLKDINDSVQHAKELASWMHGLPAKVNLLPFNEYPKSKFKTPSDKKVLAFQKVLLDKYYTTTIRLSKGRDINSACGQLVDRLNFPGCLR